MKKLLPLLIPILNLTVSYGQNVGIGTSTPAFPLTVQTSSSASNWGLMHHNGTVFLGSFITTGGIAEFGTRSAHPLYFFTNNNDVPPAITIAANGSNVGIGTTNPVNHFQIGNAPGFSSNDLAIGNGAQVISFSLSATGNTLYSNNNFALMPAGGNGFLGIGIQNPVNKLQIGDIGTTGYSGNAFVIGAVGTAMAINQTVSQGTIQSSTNLFIRPLNGSVLGHIFISGSEDVTGDANIQGSANINGDANIGGNATMNTAAIVGTLGNDAPLVVSNSSNYTFNSNWSQFKNSSFTSPIVSIRATGDVMAQSFVAVSDARMKEIDSISNGIKDLATLNAIQVTDYTMKDKALYGNKTYKKIIAQQVESVYPQVVSTHTNFIPNVYQNTEKIEKTAQGYLLTFKSKHHIDSNAKKIQLILNSGVTQTDDIIAIPSDYQVMIHSANIPDSEVFVYGEQVNDFRAVDYDGLTTLNISATQELSKQVNAQQEQIDLLKKEIEGLKELLKRKHQK